MMVKVKITLTPSLMSYMVTTPNTHHLNEDTNKKRKMLNSVHVILVKYINIQNSF
jgi:flagellar motor component MotA